MAVSQSFSHLSPYSPQNGAYKVGNFEAGEHRGEVSKQWFSRPHDQRFLSLPEMKADAEKQWNGSFQVREKSKAIEFLTPEINSREDMHLLTVRVDGEHDNLSPTNWAFGQLAGLAKAPAHFLRQLPSPIVADTLNWRMRNDRDVADLKFFGTEDGELLAANGPDYGRIPDHEVIEALIQVAGNGTGDERWKVPGTLDWSTMTYDPNTPVTKDTTTLFRSDRNMFAFLVDDRHPIEVGELRDGSPDLMFRGFYLTNSMVGAGTLELAAFYLRGVCMNRNLWGVEGFESINIRHTKKAPDRWLQEARPALRSFANGSETKLIEGVRAAKAAKVADDDEAAISFLRNRKFSFEAAKKIMADYERDEDRKVRTAWDAAQAITAFARNKPNTDTRLEIEAVAGEILDKAA